MSRRLAPEDHRPALIEAATRLIARGGLAAISSRSVAAEAGLRPSHYREAFSSHDELIAHVVRALTDGERRAAELTLPPGSAAGVDFVQVVRGAFDAYLDTLVADPTGAIALREISQYGLQVDPAVLDRQYDFSYREAEAMLAQIAMAAGCAWTEPAPVLSRRLVVILTGATSAWLADRDTAATRQLLWDSATWFASAAVRVTPAPLA